MSTLIFFRITQHKRRRSPIWINAHV